MKTIKILIIITIATLVSCNSKTVTNKSLKTELDSISYALGLDMAVKLKMNFSDVDNDLFLQGYQNGIDSTNLLLEEKGLNMLISTYFNNKRKKEAVTKATLNFGEVKKAGEVFLAENKSKEGVQTTKSGLQYIVLKEGKGANPKAADKVKVHYHGTLLDGTVFDSSLDRKTPSEFGVSQVIKGWTEGLQLMKVGSKYKFFIPQELAYGATPRGGKIKPFMPLIFEVELLEIK